MRRFFLLAMLLLSAALPAHSQTESRRALVIGNAAYSGSDTRLQSPVNDARAVAAALKDLGFGVRLVQDADHATMRQAIREFEDGLRAQKGVGFFYFAGHGVQLEGHNYLVPVASSLATEADARERAVDASALIERFRATGDRLNIIVLDACRDNPLRKPAIVVRGAGPHRGLAPMHPASGTLVAFATEPGRVATDGENGRGLYARYLIEYLRAPGLTIEQVFKRVREAVERETNGAQVPVEFSTLTGEEFYFAPAPASSLR